MWTQERSTFKGRFYTIENAVCYPRPVQKPVPLWIGTIGGELLSDSVGMNELMLDVIAREADWWNNTPASPDYCRRVLASLRDTCRRAGRDYGAIGKSLETQVLVAESQAQVRRIEERIERLNPQRAFYRDWDSLRERYIMGDVAQVTARLQQYADLGISYFMLWFMDYPSLEGLRLFASKVIPHFR
jgi:alkanesulfonate monooxygenase SsuD/methylene tetrahydromethanopterin reductase-like flavin-dependent oxidoreductase (luciferase family)